MAQSEGALTELPVHHFGLTEIVAARKAVEAGVTGKGSSTSSDSARSALEVACRFSLRRLRAAAPSSSGNGP